MGPPIVTSISHLTSKPIKIPFYKRSRHAIPRPFQPPPPRRLVYCCVVEVGDWAVRSNSPAWSQIMTSILPPHPKIRPKSPSKNEVATPSSGRSIPRPRVRSLIVVLLRSATGRCGRIHPPGYKLRPLSYPPPAQKFDKNPLHKTKPPRNPPAVSAQAPSSYV